MGRRTKQGLDYFPLDTNISQDDKIQLLEADFGLKGFAVLIKMFEKIYSDKGYYYEWDDKQKLLFAKRLGESGGLVDEVIKGSIKWGIFDNTVFNKFKVLTSAAIQKRYLEASKRRDVAEIIENFSLVDISVYKNAIYVDINTINVDINTQSKVKESKVEESMFGETPKKTPQQLFEERKKGFTDEIAVFVKTYGRDMMNDFFRYWTEPNKSKTRMRWELEKTWDIERRILNWSKREFNNKKF